MYGYTWMDHGAMAPMWAAVHQFIGDPWPTQHTQSGKLVGIYRYSGSNPSCWLLITSRNRKLPTVNAHVVAHIINGNCTSVYYSYTHVILHSLGARLRCIASWLGALSPCSIRWELPEDLGLLPGHVLKLRRPCGGGWGLQPGFVGICIGMVDPKYPKIEPFNIIYYWYLYI